MIDGDARALLIRMEAAWPTPRWGQLLIDDWVADLAPLDTAFCGTAFVKIRQRSNHRPTFADFLTEYKGLARFDGSKRKECDLCDSNGWVPAVGHGKHCKQDAPCHCGTSVVPCTCENATPTRNMHQRYLTEEGISTQPQFRPREIVR